MEKLFINNEICLYINHQELITQMYRKYSKINDCYYTLKPALFNFKAKETISNNVASNLSETNVNIMTKCTKRKKSKIIRVAEVEEQNNLQPFLRQVQIGNFLQVYQNLDSITRLWEEHYEFPKFKGCNNTQQFQQVTFGENNFIIPPLTCFFNYDVKCLPELAGDSLNLYDLIIIDMPWQNKYIKRLKKVKHSLAYQMLSNEELKAMPIPQLMRAHTLVALWCTNCQQHQSTLLEDILPTWNLQLVHTLKWFKLNIQGDLIGPLKATNHKQPYEMLYIACHSLRDLQEYKDLKKVNYILSVPSIVHSHKPPLYEWLKDYLPHRERSECLEIFARYLQPRVTSIGLEVLKLMDTRLYDKISQ